MNNNDDDYFTNIIIQLILIYNIRYWSKYKIYLWIANMFNNKINVLHVCYIIIQMLFVLFLNEKSGDDEY